MKYILSFFVALTLVGCASPIINTEGVQSNVVIKRYNAQTFSYSDSVAYFSVIDYADGDRVLSLRPDGYVHTNFLFSSIYTAHYLMAIDKYLEWEKKATDREEILEKKISKIETRGHNQVNTSHLNFKFKSVNNKTHLLAMNFCSFNNCDESLFLPIYFDRKNAENLKHLLTSFKNGVYAQDAVYK